MKPTCLYDYTSKRRQDIEHLTTSRNSAFICLSSTRRLAETAVAFVLGSLAAATMISVSKSCASTSDILS